MKENEYNIVLAKDIEWNEFATFLAFQNVEKLSNERKKLLHHSVSTGKKRRNFGKRWMTDSNNCNRRVLVLNENLNRPITRIDRLISMKEYPSVPGSRRACTVRSSCRWCCAGSRRRRRPRSDRWPRTRPRRSDTDPCGRCSCTACTRSSAGRTPASTGSRGKSPRTVRSSNLNDAKRKKHKNDFTKIFMA